MLASSSHFYSIRDPVYGMVLPLREDIPACVNAVSELPHRHAQKSVS